MRFLIDANLPSGISGWKADDCEYVNAIDPAWTDSQIWDHAFAGDLTIVSKDADFSHRMIALEPPPRVIHLRIGNMKLRDFEDFIDRHWSMIKAVSEEHKLVNVFSDRIEGIK